MRLGIIACGAIAALLACAAPAFGQDDGAPPQRPAVNAARLPSRSLEEVRQELERHKGAMYGAYNQALKRDPAIAGKVLVEFTIEASGQISQASVHSQDIADADFLAALRSVVLSFKFSDQPVATMMTTYPIDFLPH